MHATDCAASATSGAQNKPIGAQRARSQVEAGLDLRFHAMTGAALAPTHEPVHDPQDRRFIELFTHLKPYGGMLSDDELRCLGNVSLSGFCLGEALLQRELVVLPWRHRLWVPLFQFDLRTWTPSSHVVAVVKELAPLVQGFDLLEWFLAPSPWLAQRAPIDVLDHDPKQAQWAAQAHRFVIAF